MVLEVRPLVIQSSPADEDRLRLDREARALTEVLNSLNLEPNTLTILHAATKADIILEMSRRPYSIIQFSGHGHPGGIFVESNDPDRGAIVSVDEVERIVASAHLRLSVLILMSCHSAEMAPRLSKNIPVVITVEGTGNDEACIKFVSSLYDQLFRGRGIEFAYDSAVSLVGADLSTLMLRRAEADSSSKALIRSSTNWGTVFVDVSQAINDLERLNLDHGEFYATVSHKLRFHGWVFRYPRSNALLPMGNVVGRFSWDDAEDRIFCLSIYKLQPKCPDYICVSWITMLLSYHELYIADYRSPNWRESRRSEEKVFDGLVDLQNYQRAFMNPGGDFEKVRNFIDLDVKAPFTMFQASLRVAEAKYKSRDFGGCIQQLESALSSLHDALETMGRAILF